MEAQSGGRLTDPQVWIDALPEKVFAGFRDWSAGQPFTITHVRRLTSGRSGSYVAVVQIRPDNGLMHGAVLKLLPPRIGIAESRGVGLARQWTPPAFWTSHMVPATTDPVPVPMTDWWLHLQKVAHANLTQLRPLADLVDAPEFADLCGTIVDAIVDGWHLDADPAPHRHTPQSFLSGFLADHTGGLTAFADAAGLGFEQPHATVTTPGRVGPLPNPLALLAGTLTDPETGAVADRPVEIYVGNGHGDLQRFNVLVPATDPLGAGDFRLVDYGRFSPETPVSRDPVKLLLSAAEAWLPALRPATPLRSSLAELVVAPSSHPAAAPVAGYLAVSRRIHDAASRWGTRRDMPEAWTRQHLLVLLGSALRTVADPDLDLADRWWFFEVAALAARAYLDAGRHRGVAHQATPPSLVRQREARDPAGQQAPRPAHPTERADPPASTKLAFVHRLGGSWRDLADVLDIPMYAQEQFRHDEPARAVWEWLEIRERLGELPAALLAVDRADLARLLPR